MFFTKVWRHPRVRYDFLDSLRLAHNLIFMWLTQQKWRRPSTPAELDQMISGMLGPFGESFYKNKKTSEHLWGGASYYFSRALRVIFRRNQVSSVQDSLTQVKTGQEQPQTLTPRYECGKPFGKQELLRDIFLWSVYEGYVDIAFVLLLQLKSRIGAALIAASFAQRLSSIGRNLYVRNMYNEQRKAYEEYAVSCINACYKQNDHYSCQLLLREIPLFGNVTCMQVSETYQFNAPVNSFLSTGRNFITHYPLY